MGSNEGLEILRSIGNACTVCLGRIVRQKHREVRVIVRQINCRLIKRNSIDLSLYEFDRIFFAPDSLVRFLRRRYEKGGGSGSPTSASSSLVGGGIAKRGGSGHCCLTASVGCPGVSIGVGRINSLNFCSSTLHPLIRTRQLTARLKRKTFLVADILVLRITVPESYRGRQEAIPYKARSVA